MFALLLAACGGGDPARGRELYEQETIGARAAPGCVTCHSRTPGEVIVGPSHAGVAERAEAIVNSPEYTGSANNAADYLRESILTPNAHVVDGFQPSIMYASFAEVLDEGQVDDLVAYLLSLR